MEFSTAHLKVSNNLEWYLYFKNIDIYFILNIDIYFILNIDIYFILNIDIYFILNIDIYFILNIDIYFILNIDIYFILNKDIYFILNIYIYFILNIYINLYKFTSIRFLELSKVLPDHFIWNELRPTTREEVPRCPEIVWSFIYVCFSVNVLMF